MKRYEDLGRGLGGGKVFRGVLRVMMLLAGMGILVLYLRSESRGHLSGAIGEDGSDTG